MGELAHARAARRAERALTSEEYILLPILGVAVGAIGTLIGAGGGFVLIPILLLLYPHDPAAELASISLAVVALNAMSGSIGYARQKKIDYRAGAIFAIAALPGAILGAIVTGHLSRRWFDGLLGLVLVIAAGALVMGAKKKAVGPALENPASETPTHGRPKNESPRLQFNIAKGAGLSAFVGFLSSLLGIGGGIIHVPILVVVLGFPVHVATATSHFVLAITALAGTGVHIASGAFEHGWRRTIALGIGVVIGAQIGTILSARTRPVIIIRGLAIALGIVGLRLVWTWANPT
jgi:uncharacterized membrane protein YfcA